MGHLNVVGSLVLLHEFAVRFSLCFNFPFFNFIIILLISLKLKTRLYDRRGSVDQVSHLEILYNIIDKIEAFSCDKTNVEFGQKFDQLANNIESVKNGISSQISDMKEDFEMKNEFSDIRLQVSQTKEDFNAEIKALRQDFVEFRQEQNEKVSGIGTEYIRWGRSVCPRNGSDELYSGFAGGSFYNHKGAAASMLCLPKDPMWKNFDDTLQDGGLMYGAEYDDRYASNRESVITKTNHYEQDVPCVVCQVNHRSSTIMIPARTACYPGWTLEYWGYLMSGNRDLAAATNYYCVDADQEAIKGRGQNDNGYLLYFVEGRCGSLPCPPYVNGRELTCVVCTK